MESGLTEGGARSEGWRAARTQSLSQVRSPGREGSSGALVGLSTCFTEGTHALWPPGGHAVHSQCQAPPMV